MAGADQHAGSAYRDYQDESDESQKEYDKNTCIICKEPTYGKDGVKLTDKGCKSVNSASKERGDTISVATGDVVHIKCRKVYTHPDKITAHKRAGRKGSLSPTKKKKCLRSVNIRMDYSNQCLFCCQSRQVGKNGRKPEKLIPVGTETFQASIKKACAERGETDKWATELAGRLAFASDCCAYDVVYHNVCSSNFRSGYGIPQVFSHQPENNKIGRREDSTLAAAFFGVVDYIECSDYEQVTVPELVKIMQDILDKSDAKLQAYATQYLEKKLMDHFGEDIVFTGLGRGKAEVVSLRRSASKILHDFFVSTRHTDEKSQKTKLIQTAAQLIFNDIKTMSNERDTYPDFGDGGCLDDQINFLPDSLRMFLKAIIMTKDNDLKIASLGQAIIQASRPRTVMAPLQLGLGIQAHSMFASKFLVETLHRLGFCASYQEIQRYELNAAANQGIDIPVNDETDKGVIHFVADNVDHNSATLDGHGTFHGMGIVAVVTPGKTNIKRIPRRPVSTDEISSLGKIGFHFYR